MTKRIIIYRKELLRVSETFIKAQVMSYRTYNPILLGERFWPNGLALDGMQCEVLAGESLSSRIYAKARQITGFVPAAIRRKLEALNVCLFHAHFGHDAVLAWPYVEKLSVAMVVTLHGHDVNIDRECYLSGKQGLQVKNYPHNLIKLAAKKNVHFIAVSQALKKSAIAFGIAEENIRVCYTGIDTQQFIPSIIPVDKRKKQVLFIGRLVEMKGCEYLLKAFARVAAKHPDAQLVIVGDGHLRASLEKLGSGLPVIFKGALKPEEVKLYLSSSRLLCLPSVTAQNGNYEAFGMVLLEAQAMGVPVVTSAKGGREGVLDNVTGFTVEEKDIDQLAQRICLLLEDDELAARMANAGPLYVQQHFDIAKCTALIEKYYDDILEAGR